MKLDEIKKLHQKKYREACGHFLVEGEHLVLELQKAAQRDPRWRRCELYVTESYVAKQGAQWSSPFPLHVIGERQMAQLAGTQTPQGIVAVAPIPAPPAPQTEPLRAIYLHETQDPGNLGTILRTLAWFGGFRCLLSPGSVDACNPKAVRASMGAIFHVPIEPDVAIEALPARFPRIACLDTAGTALPSPEFRDFDCYVFGSEARGLPRAGIAALNPRRFTLAGSGAIESLNLATAVNICVYELKR